MRRASPEHSLIATIPGTAAAIAATTGGVRSIADASGLL
jgi:hypothetical protein